MDRNKKIIALVVGGFVVIILIVVFFLINEREITPPEQESETTPVATIDVPDEKKEIIKKTEISPEIKMASAIKPVAIAFVERFGTFTNHSNFLSIQELEPIMTETMTTWVQTVYISKLKEEHDPTGFFYRITAEAPVVLITDETAATATAKVTAKRIESIGDAEPVEFLQDIQLEMIKVNEEWLVNGAFWEERR